MLDLSGVELPILPSPDAAPFWEGAQRDELLLPWCTGCQVPFWYPRSICPRCGGRSIDWRRASGRGVVHAFTIHHSSGLAHLRPLLPVATALVELDEGVRMMGFLEADPDPASVRCGLPVTTAFRTTGGGFRVPVFVPTQAKEQDR